MRVAAGVLIIIMAVINLGGGAIYTLGGGFMASTSAAMGTDPGTADMQVTQAVGGILLLAGIGLFVLCGLEIAAGVLLFLIKNPVFVFVVAGLQIAASAASITAYGAATTASILGIIAALFALRGAQLALRERRVITS